MSIEPSHQARPRLTEEANQLFSSLADAPKVASGFVSVERRWFKVAIYAAALVLFLWPGALRTGWSAVLFPRYLRLYPRI